MLAWLLLISLGILEEEEGGGLGLLGGSVMSGTGSLGFALSLLGALLFGFVLKLR